MNTHKKKRNVVEEIIVSIATKVVDTVVDLVKNIQGLLLLVLASIGLGSRLLKLGVSRNMAYLVSVVCVTLLGL